MRSNFQKAPFYLAIFAWLMQLSVFITPVLLKHPELGFGVCEELAVVVDHSIAPHSMTLDSSDHQLMHAHSADSHQHKPIHSPFANCKFCLIFGHSFAPIVLAFIIVLLALLISMTARPITLYQFKLHQKIHLFLFQNRAPPFSSVLVV